MQRAGKKKKVNSREKDVFKARKEGIDDTLQAVLGACMFILLDKFKWKNKLPNLDEFVKEFYKVFDHLNSDKIEFSTEDIFKYVYEKSGYDLKNM